MLLTKCLRKAISDAIFSFYIIIRCVCAGWPQGSPLRKSTRSVEKESPSHGFAVTAPFRQGAKGTGVRIATTSLRTGFAMTHYKERGAWSAAG